MQWAGIAQWAATAGGSPSAPSGERPHSAESGAAWSFVSQTPDVKAKMTTSKNPILGKEKLTAVGGVLNEG